MPFTGRTSPNPTTGSFRIGQTRSRAFHSDTDPSPRRIRPPAAVENYTPPRAPAIAIAVRTDRQARGDPAPRRWVRDKNPVFGYLSATRFWRGSSIMVADIYC